MKFVMMFLLCVVLIYAPVSVYAEEAPPPDEELEVVEEGEGEGEELLPVVDIDAIIAGVLDGLQVDEEPDEEDELTEEEYVLQNPPALEGFLFSSEGISAMSIGDISSYPYTGGGFIYCQTSSGTGVVFVPEPYKVNTFGFMKGTDRVVNLTTGTVSGYWIVGGTTYSLRFTSLGQAQYYRQSGSTWVWTDININTILDTNIQYLDETGERGIQRPVLSITDKVLMFFVVFELLIHAIALMKRR